MKHINTSKHKGYFNVLTSTRSAQAAMMVLRPGQETSQKPENEHPRSEQWLFVISGTGRATIAGRTLRLRDGSLLLIEKREPHRIVNTGRAPLVTINFYIPPAYTQRGDLKDE